MIIVNDHSTDEGPQLVIVMASQDQRIRLLSTNKRGPGAARNEALRHANGDWVLFLDSDDLLESDHLEQQLDEARRNPSAHIVACGWKEFVDCLHGEMACKAPSGSESEGPGPRDSSIAFAPWAVHAALVKREVITTDCFWPEDMDPLLAEDNAFWFRLVYKTQVAYSHHSGALYRVHTPNGRSRASEISPWFEGVHAAVTKNLRFLCTEGVSPNPTQCEHLFYLYLGLYHQAQAQGSKEYAKRSLHEAEHWLTWRVQSKPVNWRLRAWWLLGLRLSAILRTSRDRLLFRTT